jgi:hypothetical protein
VPEDRQHQGRKADNDAKIAATHAGILSTPLWRPVDHDVRYSTFSASRIATPDPSGFKRFIVAAQRRVQSNCLKVNTLAGYRV